MLSSLDHMLEPGERVLERGTRFGWCRGWRHCDRIYLGLLGISAVIVYGIIYGIENGLWDLKVTYVAVAYLLVFAAAPALLFLVQKFGRYSAEAVITTHRVLAGTKDDMSEIEQLHLVDVTGVRFSPGLIELAGLTGRRICPDFILREGKRGNTFVTGREGTVWDLIQPGGGAKLALAMAAAAKLAKPKLPNPKPKWLTRFFLIFIYISFVAFIIFIYFIIPILLLW